MVYKTLIRAKIDGCNWYYPSNKSHRRKLEGIQYEAIRLALGYRRTTPINVIHAESKLPSIMDRTTYLGVKYLVKITTKRSHPLNEILEDFCYTYQIQYHTHRSPSSKDKPIRAEHILEEYLLHIEILSNLTCNLNQYTTEFEKPDINEIFNMTSFPESAASIFLDTVNKSYREHIKIFTDGFKSTNSPSVGAACVILSKTSSSLQL